MKKDWKNKDFFLMRRNNKLESSLPNAWHVLHFNTFKINLTFVQCQIEKKNY